MCWGAFGFGSGLGWLGSLFGGLMMLLFWGALIALAFIAVRSLTRSAGVRQHAYQGPTTPANDAALSLLKERYARGEISRETFEQMRADLQA